VDTTSPHSPARPRWRSALAAALTVPLGLLRRADIPLPAIIATYEWPDLAEVRVICFEEPVYAAYHALGHSPQAEM
jgi:hypothetical protein